MRRILVVLVFSVILLPTVSGAASEADPPELPRFDDSIQVLGEGPFLFPVEYGEPLKIRFGVGELTIEAADVSQVMADLDLDCKKLSESRCESYHERVRLVAKRTEGGVEVYLRGLSPWRLGKVGVEGHITVPRWSPLVADIGIGDVEILAGEEDLEVRMSIGDLTVRVPESKVGSVTIATRIGDASLRGAVDRPGRRRRLLGAQVAWTEGTGDAQIQVGLRIGDAKVVLE